MDTRATRSAIAPATLTVLLAAVSVAGCMVGPEYRRPDAKPAAQFRYQMAAAEATSIADLPWWQVFNDKALQALISEGLNNNYDLQVATTRIEQASEQVAVARSTLYPQVGYQASRIGRTKGVFALGAYQAIRLSRLPARALPERRSA